MAKAVQIALLKGINVGGNKKVSMPVLKQMFETMGFGNVRTYINSGNVVFEAEEGEDRLAERIEERIAETFGFPVSVILRSAADLSRIAQNNPFADEGDPSALHLHVGFLAETPTAAQLDKIKPYVTENDEFRVSGKELYVVFRAGMRDSKLGNNVPKIGVPITLRNWNTTLKLISMAETP